MKEMQPFTTLATYGAAPGPNRRTDMRLSGGETIPYIYSLSVRSNVPYIRLLGGSTSQKVFSWNEQIIVPPGEMVTVANDSFHKGDIIINSGAPDWGAKPSRITVPVPLVRNNQDDFLGEFPLDCRRARRAYIGGFPSGSTTPVEGASIQITTTQRAGSFPRPEGIDPESVSDNVQQFRDLGASTSLLNIALGIGALQTDTVHVLLDTVEFELPAELAGNPGGLGGSTTLLYILEF